MKAKITPRVGLVLLLFAAFLFPGLIREGWAYPVFDINGIFPAGEYKICVLWVSDLKIAKQNVEVGWSVPPDSDYDQGYPISLGSGGLHSLLFKGKLKPGKCTKFESLVDAGNNTYPRDFGLYANDEWQGNYSAGGFYRTYESYDYNHVRITEIEAGRKWEVAFDFWTNGNFDDLGISLEKIDDFD